MQDHNDLTLLSSVVADMVRRGKVTGIEVGFADEIASHLVSPQAMRREYYSLASAPPRDPERQCSRAALHGAVRFSLRALCGDFR